MVRRSVFPLLWLLGACGSAPVEEVCPLPVVEAGKHGDANGDAVVDIADALMAYRALYDGGPSPVCDDALIYRPASFDPVFDGEDAQMMLSYLYEGIAEPRRSPTCPRQPDPDAGTCGRVAWQWDVPRRAEGTDTVTAEATLALLPPALESGIEGWSVAVASEGCTIDAVHVDGTVAGPWIGDEGPGMVTGGFVMARVDDGVATSAVLLDWLRTRALPASDSAHPVLMVEVSAPAPDRGCAACTVHVIDGAPSPGQPVDSVVAIAGRSYRPALPSASISMCAQ